MAPIQRPVTALVLQRSVHSSVPLLFCSKFLNAMGSGVFLSEGLVIVAISKQASKRTNSDQPNGKRYCLVALPIPCCSSEFTFWRVVLCFAGIRRQRLSQSPSSTRCACGSPLFLLDSLLRSLYDHLHSRHTRSCWVLCFTTHCSIHPQRTEDIPFGMFDPLLALYCIIAPFD